VIFQRCIDGDSCLTVAKWLVAEQVPTSTGKPWNEGSVRDLIKNGTYAGRRMRRPEKGDKSRKRTTFQYCPEAAVIDMDTWKRANDSLKNRDKRGPSSPRTNLVKPALAKLRCLRCGSPMYRHEAWQSRSSFIYRCYGQAPQRKGCGNNVPLTETELIVTGVIFTASTEPYRIKTWVKGKNWDAQIADTVRSIHELDPMADDYDERHAALVAELREYRYKNEHEATPGRWDHVDTGQTVGEHFDALDAEGQREFMKGHDIRVEAAALGASDGIHLVIDDADCGVFRVAQDGQSLIAEAQGSAMTSGAT
jgi:hypothetical protein